MDCYSESAHSARSPNCRRPDLTTAPPPQSPRRFNVAITRAKCLMIVIGNPELLASDEHWRHLVAHAVNSGAAIGCDGVL